MSAAHAKLSASGAKRWLTCPPSAELESKIPEQSSEYAAEGTAAHELAELKLSYALGKIKKTAFTARHKRLKQGKFWNLGFDRDVDEYVTQVMELVGGYDPQYVDLEQRVDFSDVVPEGFGTADTVIVAEPVLHIVDLKFGKGVPVSAEENPQLMLYAYGTLKTYETVYDIERVSMTIAQPRLYETSTYTMPAVELRKWAQEYVKPIALLASEGLGNFKAAEEACRFCRARAVCKARAEANLEAAAADFGDGTNAPDSATMTPERIAEALTHAAHFKRWYTDIEEYALEQARDHDVRFPGYKLVEGRSNRKILDAEAAIAALVASGYSKEDVMTTPELKGITALESLTGKPAFAEILGGYVEKPPGKPTLVPESDKRPEINSADSAVADFAE